MPAFTPLTSFTRDQLTEVRNRARAYTARKGTPWLVEELVSLVLLTLARRPDLIREEFTFGQTVNMLCKTKLIDLYRSERPEVPTSMGGDDTDEADASFLLPAFHLDVEELDWNQLADDYTRKLSEHHASKSARARSVSEARGFEPARAVRAAVLVARFGMEHSEVADVLGVSRSTVSREITRLREALTAA